MARYSIELGNALNAKLGGALTTWTPSLNDYPIFNEAYRSVLNGKIIDYYYFNEIGAETIERFDHYLKSRMDLIMPKYNKMYEAYLLAYNPLTNTDLTETNSRTVIGESTGTTGVTGTASNSNVKSNEKTTMIESDTPSGNINIANVESGGYASKFNIAKHDYLNAETNSGTSTNTQNSTGNMESTETFTRTLTGYTGANVNELLSSFIKNIVNVDLLVINELRDLFMQVY